MARSQGKLKVIHSSFACFLYKIGLLWRFDLTIYDDKAEN